MCVSCSRVGIYVTAFQGLAGHQEKFHKEMSKVSDSADSQALPPGGRIDILSLTAQQQPERHHDQTGGTAAAQVS